jgi:phospholipid transport system substrate-binding protein
MKFAFVVAGLLTLSRPAAADDAKDVKASVTKTVNSVLEVLKVKDTPKDERRKKVIAIVEPVFDFKLMGKLTLGKDNWPKLDEAQRKEFGELFVKQIEDSYYEKIDLFTNETVDFEDPTPAKDKFQMMTRINSKGTRYKLLYKLYKAGSEWKVYDLEIEGISLVRSYGMQYDQVLQKGTAKDLLAKMKEKSLEQPSDLKLAAKKKKAEGK